MACLAPGPGGPEGRVGRASGLPGSASCRTFSMHDLVRCAAPSGLGFVAAASPGLRSFLAGPGLGCSALSGLTIPPYGNDPVSGTDSTPEARVLLLNSEKETADFADNADSEQVGAEAGITRKVAPFFNFTNISSTSATSGAAQFTFRISGPT